MKNVAKYKKRHTTKNLVKSSNMDNICFKLKATYLYNDRTVKDLNIS